jgi:hopene-associated glycosyltransferase HpnB
MASGLGIAALAAWVAIWILALRIPWRPGPPPAGVWRHGKVVAIVPARDEALTIALAVRSLAAQRYRGDFHIVVVDDASSDGTTEKARAAAPATCLSVIHAGPLASGWAGKVWAMADGVHYAAQLAPDWFLFTDADIVHPPGALADLVARAESGRFDLVSYMVTLSCKSFAERALVPAFVFFFFLLYPQPWSAAAAGGCVLIRRGALAAIGGLGAIRSELIDDCALARAVRRSGGRTWLGVSSDTHSIRTYGSFRQIGRMISRTAFTQLRQSTLLLLLTVAALAFVFFTPPVLAVRGSWLGWAAWLLMCAAYFPALHFYRRSVIWAPLLPLVAGFYTLATIHSAVAHWRGKGGAWKGRVQTRSRGA